MEVQVQQYYTVSNDLFNFHEQSSDATLPDLGDEGFKNDRWTSIDSDQEDLPDLSVLGAKILTEAIKPISVYPQNYANSSKKQNLDRLIEEVEPDELDPSNKYVISHPIKTIKELDRDLDDTLLNLNEKMETIDLNDSTVSSSPTTPTKDRWAKIKEGFAVSPLLKKLYREQSASKDRKLSKQKTNSKEKNFLKDTIHTHKDTKNGKSLWGKPPNTSFKSIFKHKSNQILPTPLPNDIKKEEIVLSDEVETKSQDLINRNEQSVESEKEQSKSAFDAKYKVYNLFLYFILIVLYYVYFYAYDTAFLKYFYSKIFLM